MDKLEEATLRNTIPSPRKWFLWRDYLELTKPKVVAMLLLTALVGMCLAEPGLPSLNVLIIGLFGIGLQSSAAAVFNHVIDRQIDKKMQRTFNRPLVKGRVGVVSAILFATSLMVIGFSLLLFLNTLVAWLTFASLLGYALFYTVWLKYLTPQNIVIGGLAGAMPPLLGWVAVTGALDPHAFLLVMIIFTWTPPHFWALAIHRQKDYAKADIPMLPVTHGIEFTKTMILLYSVLLVLVGLLPWLSGMSGMIYLVGSLGLNLTFCFYAFLLKFSDRKGLSFKMFKYSIWHIFGTFVVLLADHAWHFLKVS